ncbi:MAG TPA: DUF4097 family beta strand repeat-containing protein [Candidatus Aquicultor sp.]
MLGMNREEIYRKTFSVEPETVLKVYNRNGNIDVSSWDRDYIEVVAAKQNNWLNRFLKEPSIDVVTGREFVVRTQCSTFLCGAVPLHNRITVPRGVQVAYLETSTGKINVANVSGDVDAKTSTGAIQIQRADGFVRAVTSTGSIDITGVNGIYEARTSTGNISVEVQAIRDNLEIKTKTGSIAVFLSPSIAAQLEASTSNGKITYEDLPLTVSQSTDKKLIGKIGEGGGKIDIKASTGSISLKKLH